MAKHIDIGRVYTGSQIIDALADHIAHMTQTGAAFPVASVSKALATRPHRMGDDPRETLGISSAKPKVTGDRLIRVAEAICEAAEHDLAAVGANDRHQAAELINANGGHPEITRTLRDRLLVELVRSGDVSVEDIDRYQERTSQLTNEARERQNQLRDRLDLQRLSEEQLGSSPHNRMYRALEEYGIIASSVSASEIDGLIREASENIQDLKHSGNISETAIDQVVDEMAHSFAVPERSWVGRGEPSRGDFGR